MRFDNLDEHHQPGDLAISNWAFGAEALGVPHALDPTCRVAQEPLIVPLPDSRLLGIMRTVTGMIWWSQSRNEGEHWTDHRPLRRCDHVQPILPPVVSPSPYPLQDGRYLLIHHGRAAGTQPTDCSVNRHTAWFAVGVFRPHADQPLWFGESRELMSSAGVALGYQGRTDVCIETSLTHHDGYDVLWYPDRKFYLLGRRIDHRLLDG